MPKLQVDEVHPKGQVYPMLINFQNGYTTDEFQAETCKLLKNEENGKFNVVTQLDGFVYAGEEVEDELVKTFILARNRKTGKVRIQELGCAELKPVIKIENETSQLLDTSNLELSRKFGSKKQKQQMEQREKLKVNVKTVTEQLKNVTQEITEDKLDLSSYNKMDSDDFYIPPIDRTADKAEDVYDTSKILTEDEFDKIASELEDKDYTTDLHPFVKSIISTRNLTERQTILAVYASSLLKMYPVMAKDILKKTFVAVPHSPTLNEIILSNFTVLNNGRRLRSTPYKDKTLCYALVMILLINHLKFDLDTLCKDMKLTANTASMKIRVTGATVVNSNNKKIVQLKLPLNTKSSFSRRKSAKF